MRKTGLNTAKVITPVVLSVALSLWACQVAAETVDFDSDLWVMRSADVTEYMGRKALAGTAYLRDVELENGVIEVDVAVTGATSYPGFYFRMQSELNSERLYIRPHRAGRYPDAIQYTPVVNGIACWQLFNGEGYTADATIPTDEWIHFKLEMNGSQARFYLGDSEEPALVIDFLDHGVSRGSVGLDCPRDGSAYFSNLEYRADDNLLFDPPPPIDTPPGVISRWDLSQAFKVGEIDLERYPGEQELAEIDWRTVVSDESGLVNVGRHLARQGREPDCVLARATLHADNNEVRELLFGYSDAVRIFLNGRLLFSGNSAYRSRDASFLGIVGLNDAVYLPLRKGENELLLVVIEAFGGWGFACRDGNAIFLHDRMEKISESAEGFITPESIVYDAAKDVLYVSNFDAYGRAADEEGQFISRIPLSKEDVDLKWATGLVRPTGMAVSGNTLYVVERRGLSEIDTETGKVGETHPIPGGQFPNDVAIDGAGRVYVSDSRRSVI